MRKYHMFRKDTWNRCVLSDRVHRWTHDYVDNYISYDINNQLDTFVGQATRDKTSPALPLGVRGPPEIRASALIGCLQVRR